MSLASNGFMQQTLTMQASSAIDAGAPVKLTGNYTVSPCDANDAFCGVALSCREDLCAVQCSGSVTLPYSGTAPEVGFAVLACDGSGKVKTAESGTNVLIVAVDTVRGTVTCIL